MKKHKKIRPGRVSFILSYAVDLNNHDMVTHAKEWIIEDLYAACKDNEIDNMIKIVKDKTVKIKDIHSFLIEDHPDYTQEEETEDAICKR